MVPDINSIPPSPTQATTPRLSANPTPQTETAPTLNILPSNQQTYHRRTTSTSLPSPPPIHNTTSSSTSAMPPPPMPRHHEPAAHDAGPGPIRHPRPLTAAELHQQLEQEQELLVNRLTRDLTVLRAQQNASVVSNTSSASASASAADAQQQPPPQSSFVDTHLMSGPGFPLPSTSSDRRHHRTASNTSARSMSHAAAAGSTTGPLSAVPSGGGGASALEAARNPRNTSGLSMSRQNSTTSHRSTSASRNRSPPRPAEQQYGSLSSAAGGYFPRPLAPSAGPSSVAPTPGSELSPGLLPATLRYEETAQYRQELEAAKAENEALKRRIKELEKKMRERRASDTSKEGGGGGRARSESVSTTASVSVTGGGTAGVSVTSGGGGGTAIAGGRGRPGQGIERAFSTLSVAGSVGVGVPEEEVRVGESAASTGIGLQEPK